MTDKFNWKAKREKKAFLALADGAVFHGYAFGEATDTVGEAVFNTGMAGYKQKWARTPQTSRSPNRATCS